MARKPRIEQAGGIYWVTGRCVSGTRLAAEQRDLFLLVLGHAVARHRWVCTSYSVLESGYEMVLRTPEANLSRGMRDLNGEFTQAMNRGLGRSGPVFQGRFKAAAVEPGGPFLEVCRDVALAPVRAGLCRKPGKWVHGSYAPLVGEAEGPAFLEMGWVAEAFGGKPKKARARLEKFIRAGGSDSTPAVRKSLFVGSDAFGKRLMNLPEKGHRGRPAPKRRPALSALFPKSGTSDVERRDARISEARLAHGYTLAQIGRATGLHPATISRIARKKELHSLGAGELRKTRKTKKTKKKGK